MEKKHNSSEPPHLPPPHCLGEMCDFAVDMSTGEAICTTGSGDCMGCDLLEAEPSSLHDEHLVKATQEIKKILAGIPEAADGRQLSFLNTKKGLLLARVHHGKPVPAGAVTSKDDPETLSRALKLKKT